MIHVLIQVKVIPNASRNEILQQGDDVFKIKVQVPPENGKANKAVIQLLAQHFQIPKKNFKIVAGEKSHLKVIEVIGLPNTFSSPK